MPQEESLLKQAAGLLRKRAEAFWLLPVVCCLRLLPRVSFTRTLAALGLVVCVALFPVGLVIATGALIESMTPTAVAGSGTAKGYGTISILAVWGGFILLLQVTPRILAALAASMGRLVENHVQERVIVALNRPWSIAHLENPAVAGLVSQVKGVGSGGYGPGLAIYALLTERGPSMLSAVASGFLLLTYNWWAAALLFLAHVVFAWASWRSYVAQGKAALDGAKYVRRADYYRDLALAPAAAKDLRILGIRDWVIERVRTETLTGLREQWRSDRTAFAFVLAILLCLTLVTLFIYASLARDAAAGVVTIGALLVFLGSAQSISGITGTSGADLAIELGTAVVPALLELEKTCSAPIPKATVALPALAPQRDIRFERVSFSYPGGSTPVLCDLDLSIPAGTSLAIVGLNAAGKTTLIKLLTRLYDPTAGAILIDGVDLRSVDPQAWRRHVAAIFQDFQRFPLSARENVGFGGLAIVHNQEALDRSAARAGVLDKILAQPKRWETVLSRQFTDGVDLSGGEWQRLALARALFAVEGGASLLILDEPTANLDVRAEAEIYNRFLELTKGLTTILISHRFSTVRRADRICLLEAGAVAELGTHDELMRMDGKYAELFNLQASRFAEIAGVRS